MTHQDTANVRLVELRGAPYREYGYRRSVKARSRATKNVDGLLPEGPGTRNHSLYSVRDDAAGAEVGTVRFERSTSRRDLPHYASLVMRSDLLKLVQLHC